MLRPFYTRKYLMHVIKTAAFDLAHRPKNNLQNMLNKESEPIPTVTAHSCMQPLFIAGCKTHAHSLHAHMLSLA